VQSSEKGVHLHVAYRSKRQTAPWKALVAALALMPFSAIRSMAANSPITAADVAADHELNMASAEMRHINDVLNVEMTRLVNGEGGSQSPEVTRYLIVDRSRPVNLGDLEIPLHLRFIERQRRELVDGVAMANSAAALHCGPPPDVIPEQIMDAAIRARVEAGIRCHDRWMDLFQSETHQSNVNYETSLMELKLPTHTQEKMLAVAHAATVRQDADIAQSYAEPRQLNKAGMDLLKFMDAHAAHVKLADHQLLFEDQAEADEFNVVMNALKAVTQ
jgi:hypothetical protein